MDRWHAAIRIQQMFRTWKSRIVVRERLRIRHEAQQAKFDKADQWEAALLIQTQFRRMVARLRVLRKMKDNVVLHAADRHVAAPRKLDVMCSTDIMPDYVNFASPPTEAQLRTLFSRLDYAGTGFVTERHCFIVYEAMIGSLPTDEDDRVTCRRLLAATSPTYFSPRMPRSGITKDVDLRVTLDHFSRYVLRLIAM